MRYKRWLQKTVELLCLWGEEQSRTITELGYPGSTAEYRFAYEAGGGKPGARVIWYYSSKDLRDIRQAVDTLQPRMKEVAELHYTIKLSTYHIGKKLSISQPQVRREIDSLHKETARNLKINT